MIAKLQAKLQKMNETDNQNQTKQNKQNFKAPSSYCTSHNGLQVGYAQQLHRQTAHFHGAGSSIRFQVQNDRLSLSKTLIFQTKLVSSLVFTVDSSFVRNTKLLHVSLSCQPHCPLVNSAVRSGRVFLVHKTHGQRTMDPPCC